MIMYYRKDLGTVFNIAKMLFAFITQYFIDSFACLQSNVIIRIIEIEKDLELLFPTIGSILYCPSLHSWR